MEQQAVPIPIVCPTDRTSLLEKQAARTYPQNKQKSKMHTN